MGKSPDVVVVGAGVFGAWSAYQLHRSGRSVALIDAFGPGNSRASSGGESRIIRMGYGSEKIYSRWALESLDQWQALFHEAQLPLFIKTGVLFLGRNKDPLFDATTLTLQRLGVHIELLARKDLETRFPQFQLGSITRAMLEPNSGVVFARRAVHALVQQAVQLGVDYRFDAVTAPTGGGHLESLPTFGGDDLRAETFVFACGPWLPKLFPHVLGPLLHTTRQEVFFFGCEPGDRRFTPTTMPAWVDFKDGIYGIPDLDGRGFKVGLDQHGPPFDPDAGDRLPSPGAVLTARRLVATRLPSLSAAQLLDARVCQYTITWNGDFLIDRHPDFDNVWLVGGGSGHGFKHGPAVGDYLSALLAGSVQVEPRFTLVTKRADRHREIY